jgi:hypothetical protein
MASTDIVVNSLELETLVEKANTAHLRAQETATFALKYAKEAGDALREAKEQVGHGAWLDWLEGNFKGTARTAQMYMRVSARWNELEPNAASVSHLSLRAALAELTENQEDILEEIPKEEQKLVVDLVNEMTGGKPNVSAIRKMAALANGIMSTGAIEDERGQEVPWSSLTGLEKKRLLATKYNKPSKTMPDTVLIHKAEHERLIEMIRALREFFNSGDTAILQRLEALVEEHEGYYGRAA